MRRLAILAAVSFATAASAQIGPVTVAPEAKPFTIGKVQLTALRDAGNIAKNDAKVFGIDVGVEAVDGVLEAAGVPKGQVSLSINTLLVRLPGRAVLVDTGYGAPRGVMLASLEKAGLTPAKITDVLISHGHGDHVGGLVGADGKPVFARATIRMAAAEWASIKAQPNNAKLVAAIGAQVKTFTPGAVVVPGITSVDLHGHTPGHSGYAITSSGQRLLAVGDMVHSYIVSLARPEWVMGYDADKQLGKARRRVVLSDLADSGDTVFSPHFPWPGVGKVVRSGEGFAWQAGL